MQNQLPDSTIERAIRAVIDAMDEAPVRNTAELERALATLRDLRREIPLWEQRQALIQSQSTITAEQRAQLLRLASEHPGLDEALSEGDGWWQAIRTGELPGPGISGRPRQA